MSGTALSYARRQGLGRASAAPSPPEEEPTPRTVRAASSFPSLLVGYDPQRSARAGREPAPRLPPQKRKPKAPIAWKPRGGGHNGGMRRHDPLKVGQRFGTRTVTGHAPGYYAGRRDERVTWRCECGHTGESFAFNLRGREPVCSHRRPK